MRISSRRLRLAGGVALVSTLMTAPWVHADEPSAVSVELQGMYGAASGRPPRGLCGLNPPASQIRYGGVGARVRLRPKVPSLGPNRGPEVVAMGAVEHHSFTLLAPGEEGSREVPSDQPLAGASLSAGYSWPEFGLRVGITAFQQIAGSNLGCPSASATATPCVARTEYRPAALNLLPELHLRVGAVDSVVLELGWGAYGVGTVLRPGLFLAVRSEFPKGWAAVLGLGAHLSPLQYLHARGDLTVHIPVHRRVRLIAGGALSGGEGTRVEPEGRLGAELRF